MIRAARGFTLLEVMVVLVLVGIMTSFALLSAGGGPKKRLAEEAQRLAGLLQLQQQEAILRGELHGIQFTDSSYTVLLQSVKGDWQPPPVADTLIHRQLPDDIALTLWVEGQPVSLKKPGRLPQIVLLASGETTEFVVVFNLAEQQSLDSPRYRVASDGLGRLVAGEVKR